MATFLLIRPRKEAAAIFMARSRADLFKVISKAIQNRKQKFQCEVQRAAIISELANIPPRHWKPGLHLINLVGYEWMLIITENDDAFGMA